MPESAQRAEANNDGRDAEERGRQMTQADSIAEAPAASEPNSQLEQRLRILEKVVDKLERQNAILERQVSRLESLLSVA